MTDIPPETPLPLRWIRAQGLSRLTPWHLIDDGLQTEALRREFRSEVSGGSQRERDIYPFAVRQDCDDVAGFVVHAGVVTEAVVTVHLTWSRAPERPGWPQITRYPDLWSWLKAVVDDTAEWSSEADLDDPSAEASDQIRGDVVLLHPEKAGSFLATLRGRRCALVHFSPSHDRLTLRVDGPPSVCFINLVMCTRVSLATRHVFVEPKLTAADSGMELTDQDFRVTCLECSVQTHDPNEPSKPLGPLP